MAAEQPTILATSGGYKAGSRTRLEFNHLVHHAVELSGASGRAPKITHLGTAGGDQRWYAAELDEAARVAGASDMRIIFKHILPNAVGVVIVAASLIAAAVMGLCALAAFRMRPPWLATLMERSMHSSSQLGSWASALAARSKTRVCTRAKPRPVRTSRCWPKRASRSRPCRGRSPTFERRRRRRCTGAPCARRSRSPRATARSHRSASASPCSRQTVM